MIAGGFSKSLAVSIALHGAVILGVCTVGSRYWQAGAVQLRTGAGGSSPGTAGRGSPGDAYIHALAGPLAGISLPPTGAPPASTSLAKTPQVQIDEQTDAALVVSALDAQDNVPPTPMFTSPNATAPILIGLGTYDLASIQPAGRKLPPIPGGGGDASDSSSSTGQGNALASAGNGTGSGSGSDAATGTGSGTGSATGTGTGLTTSSGTGSGLGFGTADAGLSPGFGKPLYPAESRRRGEQGTVQLSVEILPDGSHGRIEILSSSGHSRLDRAALAAFQHAQYLPARLDNQPVASTKRFVIHFRLEDPA